MSKPLRTILAPADPRYGTEVHESAHAVLARLFSLNIEGIDLIVRPSDGGTSHGQFRWAPAPEEGYPLTDLELNEACIRVVMAGPIAKEMAGHDGRAGIDGDQATVAKYLGFITEKQLPASYMDGLEHRLAGEAVELVRANLPAIKRVAQLLLRKDHLSQDQVNQAMLAP